MRPITIFLAVCFGALLTLLPPVVYCFLEKQYELDRAIEYWTRALPAGVACAGVSLALSQYKRNSREQRIERSMSYWERANAAPYVGHFQHFVAHWRSCEKEGTPLANLVKDSRENEALHEVQLTIEHILDFYDEACTAILSQAADEEALYSYLGPIMLLHRRRLNGFIVAWRDSHNRPEKWDCFSALTDRWKRSSKKFEARWTSKLTRCRRMSFRQRFATCRLVITTCIRRKSKG